MVGGKPRFVEGVDADGGVPNRRETWLEPQRLILFDFELLHFEDAVRHEVTLVAVAEDTKRHDVVGHGGEDGAEATGGPSMFNHPTFGFPHGESTHKWNRVMTMNKFQKIIDHQKEVVPGE